MFLEYISNMYVLSVIATVIGLCILYMYDKFEKKQYTNAIYMRIGILIFMSCLGTIYISRMNFFQNNTNSMSGGGSSSNSYNSINNLSNNDCNIQSNDNRSYENFKTGVPTF